MLYVVLTLMAFSIILTTSCAYPSASAVTVCCGIRKVSLAPLVTQGRLSCKDQKQSIIHHLRMGIHLEAYAS
jgi:hypothetical protein